MILFTLEGVYSVPAALHANENQDFVFLSLARIADFTTQVFRLLDNDVPCMRYIIL